MGRIRELRAEDAPRIAALHRKVGLGDPHGSLEGLATHFEAVFLRHPWTGSISSLVYEEDSGAITGFLGVIPLPMVLRDRAVLGAFSSNYMVDRGSRSSLAALKLMQSFLGGPQDVSIAEGSGEITRRIWERLGGVTSRINSLQWRRPLRPLEYLHYRRGRRGPSPLLRALRPAVRAAERAVTGLGWNPLLPPRPDLDSAELTLDEHLACLGRLASTGILCPAYDREGLAWIRRRLELRGLPLRARSVHPPGGSGVGWFLYQGAPGRLGEALQVGAVGMPVDGVIDRLLRDAWEQGLVGIGGRLQPPYMQELVRRSRLLQCDEWVFVHSRDEAIRTMFDQGNAFLTHMEGEHWMNYAGGSQAS